MFSSNPDKWFLAFVAALALSGVACSPASMFARAAAANRERYGYGTAASPGGVPSWAIHVARPKLDGGATLDTLEARLIRELTEDKILEVFVSPEQLGAVAVRELQKGHPFDAAALLALASYRRFQQAEAAYDYGLTDGLRVARERVGYGRIAT